MRSWAWVVLGLALAQPGQAADPFEVSTVSGQFGDVRDSLVQAIEGRGLVISYVAQVGEMLDRTAPDLGATRRIYGSGEVLEFCSAKLSRQMMEADPRNLVFCPYSIAIYTIPEKPGQVFLARKHLPAAAAFAPVEALLKDIVAEAAR